MRLIALLQHHFFSAWIPDAKEKMKFTLNEDKTSGSDLIRAMTPPLCRSHPDSRQPAVRACMSDPSW